jgi:hypothetical protein
MSDDWMNLEQLRAALTRERELLTKACAERDRLGQQMAADREAQSVKLSALRDAVKQARREGVEEMRERAVALCGIHAEEWDEDSTEAARRNDFRRAMVGIDKRNSAQELAEGIRALATDPEPSNNVGDDGLKLQHQQTIQAVQTPGTVRLAHDTGAFAEPSKEEKPCVTFTAEELASYSCQQCGDTDDDCYCRAPSEPEKVPSGHIDGCSRTEATYDPRCAYCLETVVGFSKPLHMYCEKHRDCDCRCGCAPEVPSGKEDPRPSQKDET